jgi:hypothetical protein
MSFRLARNVFELLRGTARPQTLDRLRREGHKRVPVLRFSELEALMQASVADTLTRLGLELSDEKVQGLNDEARLRFLALLTERAELKETLAGLQRQGDRLEASTEGVRAEIERAETELAVQEEETPEATPDEELNAFHARLRTELTAVLSGPGLDPGLTERALAAVDTAVENYRILVTSRVRREAEARIEQLHRRLQRLRRKLEESQALLARARAAGAGGVPELFELGPALQPGDLDYAHKRGLLDEVFKLNVELRRMIAGKE